jgi:hypothetical protein
MWVCNNLIHSTNTTGKFTIAGLLATGKASKKLSKEEKHKIHMRQSPWMTGTAASAYGQLKKVWPAEEGMAMTTLSFTNILLSWLTQTSGGNLQRKG